MAWNEERTVSLPWKINYAKYHSNGNRKAKKKKKKKICLSHDKKVKLSIVDNTFVYNLCTSLNSVFSYSINKGEYIYIKGECKDRGRGHLPRI